MKFDELKPLVFSLNDLAYVDERAVEKNFENPHDHAVYKAAEVDEAIAELKEKLHDIDNQWNEQCKEIAELKDVIHELQVDLEGAKATAYADSVDAGMRERRLRRALWLARAEWAKAEHAHWATIWFCDTKAVLNINKSSVSQEPYRSNTFKNASTWRNMWYDIANKCLNKAEEYK